MTPLRCLAITFAPFLVSGACAQLIGLSEYEKGAVSDGDGDEGGESGAGGSRGGNGGSSGSQSGGAGGRGGSRTGGEGGMGGEAGEKGDAGMGGEPTGGTGGAAPRGGAGGLGGTAGGAGGGSGGSAGSNACDTVVVPLVSANFDQDTSAWIPWSDGSAIPIIVSGESLGITADTSPNVAHLAGAPVQFSGQFQTITIPAGAVTITLTGYRQTTTEEDPEAEVYDEMAIQMWEDALNPTEETGVGTFAYFSNQDPTNGWTMFEGIVAVGVYAGQTVDLDMWSFTDDTLLTHFYLDSLALTALVCQ